MRLLQSIYASERNAGDISISLSDFNEFLETGGFFISMSLAVEKMS
ncbi:MAG: hypothetical protein MSA33_00885 [Campylobacter sp.]|nr:hypothetical protein [Campylobacter sp.]MCI7548995.1 hypothetical protein [Campylobacter sp.]